MAKKGKARHEAGMESPDVVVNDQGPTGKKIKEVKRPKEEKKLKKVKKASRIKVFQGITGVDLILADPSEPSFCAFDAATGHLTLHLPRGQDGAAGTQGLPGCGLDYSRIPGREMDYFLFVDEGGHLCYSGEGVVSFVKLSRNAPKISGE